MASSHNLVFLHGWGTLPDVWKHQLKYFSNKYEVHAPPLPFFYRLPITDYRLPILIGWSYGGMQAVKMAAESNNIKALVLVGSSAKFTDAQNGMHPAIIKKIRKGLQRDFEKTMRDCYKTFFSATENEAAERFIATQGLPDKKMAIDILDELAEIDLRRSIKSISAPTLVIHGDQDQICPLSAARFMHENIKGSVLHIIRGAGHMPFYTRPQEFNAITEEFLTGVK